MANRRRGEPAPYRATYNAYMRSDAWRRRRAAFFVSHEQRCAACRSSDKIELHHRSYANFQAEHDEDLVPVCAQHHAWIHFLERTTSTSLGEATDAVISAWTDPRQPRRHDPHTVEREPMPERVALGRVSSMDAFFRAERDGRGAGPTGASMNSRVIGELLRSRAKFRRLWEAGKLDSQPRFRGG